MKRLLSFFLMSLSNAAIMGQQWTGTWATATETPFSKGDMPKHPFTVSEQLEHWYTIAAIDVQPPTPATSSTATPATTPDGSPSGKTTCIAILGNSITDGRGSTTDAQNRWTDVLAEQLSRFAAELFKQ